MGRQVIAETSYLGKWGLWGTQGYRDLGKVVFQGFREIGEWGKSGIQGTRFSGFWGTSHGDGATL